jgi:O-antigen/teichoic acid export membrane protein
MKFNRNISNLFYLFLIEFSLKIISFAAITYLARILGASGFGVINISMAILSYALIFGTGGLNLLGLKKSAATSGNLNLIVSDISSSRIILSSLSFIAALLLTYLLFSSEIFAATFFYLLFLFPFALTIDWFFQGRQQMGVMAVGRVLSMIVYLGLILLLVHNQADLINAGIAWSIGGLINMIFLLLVFYKRGYALKFRLRFSRFLSYLKEAFPLGAAAIIAEAVVLFPILFLGIISTSEQTGIFSAGFKIMILFLALDRIFNALFFPKIVSYIKQRRESLSEIFALTLKIVTIISLTIGIGIIYFSRELVLVIFGADYFSAIIILQILCGHFIFSMINSVFTFTLIGLNREKAYSASMFIGAMGFLLAALFSFYFNPSLVLASALIVFQFITFGVMAKKLSEEIQINIYKILLSLLAVPTAIILLQYVDESITIKSLSFLFIIIPLTLMLGRFGKKEYELIRKTFI